MNTLAILIPIVILGLFINLLIDEKKDLKNHIQVLNHNALDMELEISRKDFTIRMLKEEHKKEIAGLKIKLAASRKDFEVVQTQNEALKTIIRTEQEKQMRPVTVIGKADM